jgi:FHS family L-fucose permease-like MFS transporter
MAGIASAASPIATSSSVSTRRFFAPLTVLTALFFMWGFLTCMNDIIIPHLKGIFALSYAQAMMIQFAFFAAYFVMSLPSGAIVEKLGYKSGILIGLVTAALGCALFYPAAGERSYALFLGALFVLASGITLLQVAANPLVAALGNPETASARLTLTQAFNSLGTTLAPLFGSWVILSTTVKSKAELALMSDSAAEAYRIAEAGSVQKPYLGLALALLVLAIAIAAFRLPIIPAESADVAVSGAAGHGARKSAWGYRHLVLGAFAIFFYVGGEVSIGSFLVNYFKEPVIGGLAEADGAKLVAFYWGGAMVGRFLGTLTLRVFKPSRVLAIHAALAVLLIAFTMATSGPLAIDSVLAIGLVNSIMFPTIFTLAIHGLGEHTGQGSGILCMAIVGGAVLPVVQGAAADAVGIHHCFVVAALCYLYVAWYGAKGSNPNAGRVAIAAR